MYQCVAIVAIAGEREPTMLLWEWRAGGRGMPRLRPKYLQPMNLRPHILTYLWFGLAWDFEAGGYGMLRPKYQQPMILRPHILPFYGLVWLGILKQVDMTMVFSACPATPEQKFSYLYNSVCPYLHALCLYLI